MSDEIREKAGILTDALKGEQIQIRGRDQPMLIRTVAEPSLLPALLDSTAATRP